MEKICTKCNFAKDLDSFGIDKAQKDGHATRCIQCKREASRKYRAAHPEKVRAATAKWQKENVEAGKAYRAAHKDEAKLRSKLWNEGNPEAAREKTKRWRLRNPDYAKAYAASYNRENAEKVAAAKKKYRQEHPEIAREEGARRRKSLKYRIEATFRSRIHRTLKKTEARLFDQLGYSTDDLRRHLERQFTKGMSWQNYGEWHIDHILPLASFVYTSSDESEFRAAWALSNLRPLWAKENRKKSDKVLTLL